MTDTLDTLDTPTVIEDNGSVPFSKKTRGFFFTWNNYPDTADSLLKSHLEKFKFQPEVGKEGTPHLQGVGYFKNPRTYKQICDLFPGIWVRKIKKFHAAMTYVGKEETRTGPTQNNMEKKVKDPLVGKKLWPWQEELLKALAEPPDDRKIIWFVDKKGGRGKTMLAKSLCINRNDVLYLSGKASDMKYGVCSWLEKNNVGIIILDFARSQENYISYQGIEEVKNGIFYNTKYESKMVCYDQPHVVVFSNFEPDMKCLSEDRWEIIRLDDKYDERNNIINNIKNMEGGENIKKILINSMMEIIDKKIINKRENNIVNIEEDNIIPLEKLNEG